MPDPSKPIAAPATVDPPDGATAGWSPALVSADPPDGATAGWVPAPASAELPVTVTADAPAPLNGEPTHTQQLDPTPGPGHPDRRTLSEETERVGQTPSTNPPGLPHIPGYRIEKLIGRGGMGQVYRAIDLKLDRVIALKVIAMAGRDETSVRTRFNREVQALALIRHPNVVQVHHAGECQGFPYFTMEYVPGGALSQHLARFTGNSMACARLVARIARAVQALHEAGVIHRDLKPLNILLGEDDRPLVADFGLARWLDDRSSDVTVTHVPIGTRLYMAPELAMGKRKEYGVPCDVWAIGITLYELLAGTRPFHDNDDTLFEQILTATPPPLPDTIPLDLATICWKCLAKKPGDRYPSAAGVAEDLENWLDGLPIKAAAATEVAPLLVHQTPTRKRLLFFGIVALVGPIAILTAILLWPKRFNPTIPERWPAERLAAGETVTIVGDKGEHLVLCTQVPGCDCRLSLNRDGFATLSSLEVGAVEFWNAPLPFPVRLDLEFTVTSSRAHETSVGPYVGRKETPAANGLHQTLVWFALDVVPDQQTPPKWFERRSTIQCWGWDGPMDDKTTLEEKQTPIGPPVANAPRDWQRLSIVIDADQVDGLWNGDWFKPVMGANVLRNLNLLAQRFFPPGGLNFTPPAYGAGLGLMIYRGEIEYRNVKLVPLSR